jgi:predicted permease
MWPTRGDRRDPGDDDIQREIDAHLDLETDDQQAAGRSRDEAARAAHRAFGNVARTAEDTREIWGRIWLVRLVQDLQYAVRVMRRSPIVTTLAVLSLGLGIGANSAIFSVFDALLVKTLPVSAPAQLVDFGVLLGSAQIRPFTRWNYEEYVRLGDGLAGMADVVAIGESDRSNLGLAGAAFDPGPVHVALVSGNYFSIFGIGASSGRVLTVADDRVPGGHPVAVISDAYRRRHFAEGTRVVGRALTLNDTTYDIIGVASSSFTGDWVGHPADVWIPMAMQSQVMIERAGLLTSHGPIWIRIVARMHEGVAIDAVRAAANTLLGAGAAQRVVVRSDARGYSDERMELTTPLIVVVVIVGLVLVIACANVANLQLARATTRRTEMAVRSALGASRARLVRQALTESALLAACAGAIGLGLAVVGMRILDRLVASGTTDLALDLHLDRRVLLVTSATTMGTAVVFGLALARAAWTRSLSQTLATRGADATGAPLRFGLTKTLVTVQVAVSMILLVGATLFIRTLRNLETQPLGLDRSHVLLVEAAPMQEGVVGAGIAELMTRLPAALGALPDVRATAASAFAPLEGVGNGSRCTVAGYTDRADDDGFVRTNTVTPRYFETVGMTLVAGRAISVRDTASSARVAVINETMARYYWHTANAVGQRFGLGRDTGNEIEVIGIVKDARLEDLRDAPDRTAFLPYGQDTNHLRSLALEVRTDGPDAAMRMAIRDRLHVLAPTLPVVSLHSIDDNIARMLWTERLVASLSALFGGLALLLTCLGLYGVMSYIAVRRTNEIGIRLALGASRGQTMWLVLIESFWQVALGLVIGVPSSLMLIRVTTSLLFGVTATDLATIAEAGAMLVVVGAMASSLPAYRATRVNVVRALRAEG